MLILKQNFNKGEKVITTAKTRIDKALSEMIKSIPKTPQGKVVDTGTTIVGVMCKDAVVIAADRQSSSCGKVVDINTRKVHKISKFSVFAAAGRVGEIQLVRISFAGIINALELSLEGDILPASSQRKIFSKFFRNYYFGRDGDISSHFVFAGFDVEENKGFVLETDFGGAVHSHDKFVALGSGGEDAEPILEDYFSGKTANETTIQTGVLLSLAALRASGKKDVHTGNIDLYAPMIYVIGKSGCMEMDEESMKKALKLSKSHVRGVEVKDVSSRQRKTRKR